MCCVHTYRRMCSIPHSQDAQSRLVHNKVVFTARDVLFTTTNNSSSYSQHDTWRDLAPNLVYMYVHKTPSLVLFTDKRWRGMSLKHLLDAESRVVYIDIDVCVVYIHIDVCVVYRIHKMPSLLLSHLFSTRAYNICKTQHSVRFLSFTYSETRILASDSHSIFWNSDFRQRFPLKSTEIWRSKKHWFCVLKFPLSPLHLTRGYTHSTHVCVVFYLHKTLITSFKRRRFP